MGLFSKKPKRVDPEKLNEILKAKEQKSSTEEQDSGFKGAGNVQGFNLEAEFTKLNARLQSIQEQQKVAGERFSRLNEQIGEVRAMVFDADKRYQQLEIKALKAIDMVETVQPDRLMIETQKQDGKIEALRASIEGNEIIMKNITEELRGMRKKLDFFKGIDQVTKMYDEVKSELADMKKMEATISRHADKVETIFGEFQKTFQEFGQYSDRLKGIEKQSQQTLKNLDEMKVKTLESVKKADFDKLVKKVDDFEKHASEAVELVNKRANQEVTDIKKAFNQLEKTHTKMFNERFEESKKAVAIFRILEKRAPEIAKQLGTNDVQVEEQQLPEDSNSSETKETTPKEKKE